MLIKKNFILLILLSSSLNTGLYATKDLYEKLAEHERRISNLEQKMRIKSLNKCGNEICKCGEICRCAHPCKCD